MDSMRMGSLYVANHHRSHLNNSKLCSCFSATLAHTIVIRIVDPRDSRDAYMSMRALYFQKDMRD